MDVLRHSLPLQWNVAPTGSDLKVTYMVFPLVDTGEFTSSNDTPSNSIRDLCIGATHSQPREGLFTCPCCLVGAVGVSDAVHGVFL